MGFVELENTGKKLLEQFPVVKRSAKRVYQLLSYVTSDKKTKYKGAVTRVSPEDGFEYFYGYYDKSPWDADDRYMIALKVKKAYKAVAPGESGCVVLIDTWNENKVYKIGMTQSWNVQQGCRAQWMGPDFKSRIIYNDFREGKYCSVIYNWELKKEEKVLMLPVYDVAEDGSFALSLDFSRLHRMRPGYGYSNLPDKTRDEPCPDKTCIWKLNIVTGEVTELWKYTDMASFEQDETMHNAAHKVNHLMISPDGKRFMVLHRWFQKGHKHTRLVTANVDGTERYNLSDDVFVSHCCWKNNKEILAFLRKKETGNHYYLMKDQTQEYKLLWPKLNTDGHCSYSPDGQNIITDTYPDRKRIAGVYLCREENNHSERIASVFAPFRYDNDWRCDLHPRWNRTGDTICIDSVHEGKRALYTISLSSDMEKILDTKYLYKKNRKDIDIEGIKKKLSAYEYVSFDIFDTLIKRNVEHPSDVFLLTQRRYEQNHPEKLGGFKSKRAEAERKARDKSKRQEITIQDIYKELDMDLSRDVLKALMETEIETELSLCCVNKPLFEIYNYCVTQGKKILIISNMYLPQSVIEHLLHQAGYTQYRKLYLSCAIGLKKSDGELFRYALKDQKIKQSQIVHVGDSWKADYIQARRIGIEATHIEKHQNYLEHNRKDKDQGDSFDISCIQAFINNHIDLSKNAYYRFGYESFGILLYGFNRWMAEDMNKKKITDVFFFSRDGHVIKRAFDIQYQNSDIKSHYFYVSRRALRVPQLWLNPEYEQVIAVFPLARLLTAETFIKNLGLAPENYTEVLKKHGLTLDTVLKKAELPGNETMKAFYKEIRQDVILHSKEECSLFLEYMKQNGFLGKIAVVDIGWHGTLQYFIEQMAQKLHLNLEMQGYYIGLAAEAKRQIEINGYVVDKGSTTNSCDTWKSYNGLVENLFLAQEGSAEKFKKTEYGTIIPVLYPYEYADENGEKEWEAVKVGSLQDGAIDFVRDITESGLMDVLQFTPASAFFNINETGTHPSRKDLELFADFRFLEEQVDFLAMPESLLYYVFHRKQFQKDIGFSRWKIGFMKKLFKLPLPYEKMYQILRKLS